MAKIIIYTNSTGGVSICYPTGELPIETVLVKDCPNNAIIIDDSELPQDPVYFNAWELVNGRVTVNQTKKQDIISAKQNAIDNKQSALNKLATLSLTQDEVKALIG